MIAKAMDISDSSESTLEEYIGRFKTALHESDPLQSKLNGYPGEANYLMLR